MKICKILVLSTIFFFTFTLLTPTAMALRTCSSGTGCGPGETCAELYVADQCVDSSGDRIYYITGRCSGYPATACPSGFTCQTIPTHGYYCITNEAGMASTSCPVGQELVNGACQTASAATTGPVEFTSPIGAVSPTQILGQVIKTVLGILGAIALAMFVWGGQGWMLSGGNPEKIKAARATLVWAVLGMAVVFLSYAAVDFVLSAFGV
ncbi:MAG: pilin [Patescibacteria group bacterium]